MPEAKAPQLHENLYAVIAYVHGECTDDLMVAIQDCGLTFSQLRLLHYLARAPVAPTVKHAAYVTRMRPNSMSAAVQGLHDRGLVDRVEDHRDGRARRLLITPRGRETVEQMSACRLDALQSFSQGLEPDERQELDQLAARLCRRPEIARRRPAREDG